MNRAAKPYLNENFLSIENYVGIFIFVAIKPFFCGRISGAFTNWFFLFSLSFLGFFVTIV